MGLINDCAKIFSKYIGYNYTLELDCCYSIEVAFKSDQFHHLIGLHYLEDTKEVNSKIETNSPKRIFKNIISNKITQESIEKSKQYYKIKERVENFLLFDNVLTLPTAKAGGFLFLPLLHWLIPYGIAMSYTMSTS